MPSHVLDAPTLAQTSQYIEPARCRIQIWDYPKHQILYEYDSFHPEASAIFVTKASVEIGQGQAGTFSVTIPDPDKSIPSGIFRKKNTVIIQAKKYLNELWTPLIYGFTEKVGHYRDRSNMLEYTLSGLGSGSLLNHRIIDFKRVAKGKSITDSLNVSKDPAMQGRKLYRDLFSEISSYVVQDMTLEEQGQFDMSLLDTSDVTDELVSIQHPSVQASQVHNTLVESLGVEAGVNALNQPFIRYPTARHSGIVLKMLKPEDSLKDLARNTSYFIGPWNYEIDWSHDSGFTNRFITKARTQSENSVEETSADINGSTSLNVKDLAVKIPPNVSSFTDISIIVSKVGEGKDPRSEDVNTLHGHIVEDENGFPNGTIRAFFDIPLHTIPTVPTPIFLGGAQITGTVNTSKQHWIILYKRGIDEKDTIHWHHVPSTTGTIGQRQHIPGVPWAIDHNLGTGWEVTLNTIQYAFSIFDSFIQHVIASDVDSQDRFGLVETAIEVPWAANASSANRYAHEKLWWSSMPKILFQANTVTIPTRLFQAGDIVQIQDDFSDLPASDNIMAEIVDVRYDFGGNDQYGSLGAAVCSLTPVGFYDFRAEDDIC